MASLSSSRVLARSWLRSLILFRVISRFCCSFCLSSSVVLALLSVLMVFPPVFGMADAEWLQATAEPPDACPRRGALAFEWSAPRQAELTALAGMVLWFDVERERLAQAAQG